MIERTPGTIGGGRSVRAPIILGIAMALTGSAGCASYEMPRKGLPPPGPAGLTGDRSGARSPTLAPESGPTVTRAEDSGGHETPPATTSREDEPAAVLTPPVPEPEVRAEPPDSGAVAMLESMLEPIDEPQQGEDGVTRIGLSSVRNQSRSSRADFVAMRRVVMEHLTRAGRDRRIVFTDAEEVPLQYRLEGTAYRLGGNGDARWELFVRLQREEDGLLIWEPDGPVRVSVDTRDGESRFSIDPQ